MRQLVGLASLAVRLVRERRLGTRLPPGVWIADDEDAANIGDPLARIAARHTPLAGDAPSDVVDGIEAMFGTAAYATKHLGYEAQLAEYLAAETASTDQEDP